MLILHSWLSQHIPAPHWCIPAAPTAEHSTRGVKYSSHFTWLLYLSINLGDFYFIQVQFKLTTCTFTWLHFWRKNSTFYSLQFYFNVKSTLHFYFILCTLNMVNGISKVHAWRENQWSLFSCIKHTVLLQLWLSSGKCLGSKIHHQI